jgi:hypothetical protein
MPDSTDPRAIDRLLQRLRSHIRSHRLPRPNRVTFVDSERTCYLDYGVGDGVTRLRNLVRWSGTLPATRVRYSLRPTGYLAVWLSGQVSTTSILVSAGADIRDLGGTMTYTSDTAHGHLNGSTLPVNRLTDIDPAVLLTALSSGLNTGSAVAA